MPHLGYWEIPAIAAVVVLKFGMPVAVCVWFIVMLNRVRSNQKSMTSRLDAIERALQK